MAQYLRALSALVDDLSLVLNKSRSQLSITLVLGYPTCLVSNGTAHTQKKINLSVMNRKPVSRLPPSTVTRSSSGEKNHGSSSYTKPTLLLTGGSYEEDRLGRDPSPPVHSPVLLHAPCHWPPCLACVRDTWPRREPCLVGCVGVKTQVFLPLPVFICFLQT